MLPASTNETTLIHELAATYQCTPTVIVSHLLSKALQASEININWLSLAVDHRTAESVGMHMRAYPFPAFDAENITDLNKLKESGLVFEAVIAEKETIERTHTFIMNEDLPHEDPGNQFQISWDEDTILQYKIPRVYAFKRPTWEVNPTRKIEDFKLAFYTDLGDAMMRFACMPTYSSDAFFKQIDKVEKCMNSRNPLDSFRRFDETFVPDPEKRRSGVIGVSPWRIK